MGLANGKGFEEALHDASHKGLDTFANTFLITSVVASVGVASGAIKPSACFVAGTRVIVGIDDGHFVYLPIESSQIKGITQMVSIKNIYTNRNTAPPYSPIT
jgi:hypothetical protein